MSGVTDGSLQPTWFGYVTTEREALILFEACLNGALHHFPRRPHARERTSLIKSGCVFIYEENASGIKRWTDGLIWSPSRILGNFLVYRERMESLPPRERKRAIKKNKRATKPRKPYPKPNEYSDLPSPIPSKNTIDNKETERALIASLVDSYGFKDGGLVKKTMSVKVHGAAHHLVSYYKIEDALDGTLSAVSKDPRLANTEPRPELIIRQNFMAPPDDTNDGLRYSITGPLNNLYGYNGYCGGSTRNQSGLRQNQTDMNLPYSTATHMRPGTPIYTPILSTQAYYPPPFSNPHLVMPKQGDYGMYNQNHPSPGSTLPESTNSHPQSNSISGLIPLYNGMLESPSPGMDLEPMAGNNTNWSRNGTNGVYATTANPPPNLQLS